MWKKAIYIGTGIVLSLATIMTGSKSLSDSNIENYKRAAELQDEMAARTFSGYHMTDYPVAFFDGTYDYVVTGGAQERNINIERRKPVIGSFVGTAYEVEGHYEILLPTVEQFSGMVDVLSAVQTFTEEKNTLDDEVGYSDEEHIATIFHEGFHAWQMSNFEKEMEECLQGRSFLDDNFGESLIVEKVDHNPVIVAYYERIEGTAFYIESKAYEMLKSEEEYRAKYVEPINHYSNGTHKYYSMGMAKCCILDKLCSDWRDTYTFSESLTEMLCQQAG